MRTHSSILHARAIVLLLIVVPALVGISFTTATAQRGTGGSPRTQKPKKVVWSVAQVGEDFKVVEKSKLNSFKKEIEDQYRSDLKAWNASKKAAAKARESFDAPKPTRLKVKVVKKTFKTEIEAKAHATLLKKRLAKKSTAKEAFVVVDVDGNLKVATKSEVAAMKKQADNAFRQALKEYTQAKKDAARKKEKFDDPKPKKSVIKIVGPSFKSLDKAEAHLKKLLTKREKKAATKK